MNQCSLESEIMKLKFSILSYPWALFPCRGAWSKGKFPGRKFAYLRRALNLWAWQNGTNEDDGSAGTDCGSIFFITGVVESTIVCLFH